MRLFKILPQTISPLRSIEWVIATITLIIGLYIFSPLYTVSQTINGTSAFASALSHPLLIFVYAAVLIVGSGLVMIGLRRRLPQLKSAGWFIIALTRFFQVLTTILVLGPLPISWIHPFTIMLIVVILWGVARVEVKVHARS